MMVIADSNQGDLAASKEKKQQLQTMLDTTKHMSRGKDQQISRLEIDLQAVQEKLTVHSEENKEKGNHKQMRLHIVPCDSTIYFRAQLYCYMNKTHGSIDQFTCTSISFKLP